MERQIKALEGYCPYITFALQMICISSLIKIAQFRAINKIHYVNNKKKLKTLNVIN